MAAFRFRTLVPLLLLGWLLCAPLAAAGKQALVGGRLIDGFGHRPLADSVILIDGDTIERVGTVDTLPAPEGYEVISTESMDVLPGLWESHAHLMLNGHADYTHWHPTYRDRFADEIMPASAVQLLLAGVTSVRDLGGPLYWTPTVEGLFQYELTVDNPEMLDSDCWHRGLQPDIIAADGDVPRYINLLQDVDFVIRGGTVYKRDGRPVEDAL